MGVGGFLSHLTEGFANAAGDTQTADALVQRRADFQKNLKDNTTRILTDVTSTQEAINALDKNSPTYKDDLAKHSANKIALQKELTQLYHPTHNPGALQHLGGFIKEHVLRQKRGVPKTPAEAKLSTGEMAQFDSAAARANPPQRVTPNPILVKRQQMTEAGFSPEQIKRVEEIDAGLAPKGSAKTSDYTASLRRFVQAEGGDPDNPTAAQEEAFRVQRAKDAAAARATDTTRTSTTTDPFGLSNTTTSTTHRAPAGSPTPAVRPSTSSPIKTPAEAKSRMRAVAPAGAQQLDAQGHIPNTANVNPHLREAANQLIDGMDVEKLPIPQRDREAAASLARKYGWKGQGLFTPKEQLLVREASTFLKKMRNDPKEMAIFDLPLATKAAMIPLLTNPDKQGMLGNFASMIASGNITQEQADALAAYRQLVGTISGLSQLTKGGRATEAQIERLKQELPNLMQTANSTDAKNRLDRLLSEIDVAQQKGAFTEQQQSSDEVYARDPQGKRHKGKKGTALPPGWKLEDATATQ